MDPWLSFQRCRKALLLQMGGQACLDEILKTDQRSMMRRSLEKFSQKTVKYSVSDNSGLRHKNGGV